MPREKNAAADKLANQAMDARADVELKGSGAFSCATPASTAPAREPLRLGILLSGGGRTMLNIQEQIEAGRLNAKIVTVISSRSDVTGVERP